MQQDPAPAGAPFFVTIYGRNFGPYSATIPGSVQGTVQAYAHTSGRPGSDLAITQPVPPGFAGYAGRYAPPGVPFWCDNKIGILVTPSNSAYGPYDLVVQSAGVYFSGYAPAGFMAQSQSYQAESNRGWISVDPPLYTVKGRIITIAGNGLAGMTVNANGQSVQTGADGSYSFSFPAGANVVLSPSPTAPYTYTFTASPPSQDCQLTGTGQCTFSNLRQDELQNFTPNYVTAFLLHGIGQRGGAMDPLGGNLKLSGGLDLSQFVIDSSFDFGECAANKACTNRTDAITGVMTDDPCSVSAGARKLAQYIAARAPGDFVLVGYSMGGLIARSLLINAAAYVPGQHARGLITLGTPHWGYPYFDND